MPSWTSELAQIFRFWPPRVMYARPITATRNSLPGERHQQADGVDQAVECQSPPITSGLVPNASASKTIGKTTSRTLKKKCPLRISSGVTGCAVT